MLKDSKKNKSKTSTSTKSKTKGKEVNFNKDKDSDTETDNSKLIESLNELKGKVCLNTNGKSYYVSEYSLIEESVKKVEEKYFFSKREVGEVVPEFISEIVTINGSEDKLASFSFDENGKNLKIPYYTIEDVIYNFMVDRERYLMSVESLTKLGVKIESNGVI